MIQRPAFLITIDTEGDNAWSRPDRVDTQNARYLPRFQSLCERHGFKPTYLTNYEMAMDPFFVEFGRDVIERGAGEIGMHLHAWHSPPEYSLTANDTDHHPYLIEYPDSVMEAKIAFMTDLLEKQFGVKMTSHRAGRWAFDERYARLLLKYGYTVDCSVTPGISWRNNSGAPGGKGGTDYTHFPDHAYFLDPDDISHPGHSGLLELPMTITRSTLHRFLPRIYEWGLIGKTAHRLSPPIHWFRPLGENLLVVHKTVQKATKKSVPYMEFMQHSSEFMPGGSPYFPDTDSVEKLFNDLEALFELIRQNFAGATLSEYRADFASDAAEGRVS